MRNIKLIIEYEGSGYSGWQVQNGSQRKTVQETIEVALARILQEKIKLIGSGRTDSGVHAQAQIANFKTKSRLDCADIKRALNSVLPADIRIKEAKEAHPDFHARFAAQSKTYRYTIVNDSFASPFLRRYAHLIKYPLSIAKMRKAGNHLIGRHNLASFQAQDKRERPAVRTIKRLNVRKSKNLIQIDIEADGFLYRMVRNIVGTLIEVGRKRLEPEDIKAILKAKNRIYAGPCAPARGLCLLEVRYKKG